MPAPHSPEFRRRALALDAQGNPVAQDAHDSPRDLLNERVQSQLPARPDRSPVAGVERLDIAFEGRID